MSRPADRLRQADRVGFAASMLCAIHCAAMPLLLAILPTLGLGAGGWVDLDQAVVVFATLLANWQVVIAGMMMVAMTTTAFYLITVYAPTFGKKVLMLSASDSLLVTLLVAISNFFWLPVGGALSDRFGRRSVLIAMTLLALATAWPALTLLANAPSFLMMLSVLLWLSFIYGMYNGAMIPALTEIMPAEVRVAGFSLAYSLATAVFGGFTPVISTALIEYTGDKASPGYWMSFAAICGLLATCYLYRRSAVALQTAR